MNFVMNSLIASQVGSMPEVVAACSEAAKDIAAEARDIAPVVSGDYRDGIVTQDFKGGARVLATDQKSHWIEFGNGRNMQAQFILRTAATNLGYKFKSTHA